MEGPAQVSHSQRFIHCARPPGTAGDNAGGVRFLGSPVTLSFSLVLWEMGALSCWVPVAVHRGPPCSWYWRGVMLSSCGYYYCYGCMVIVSWFGAGKSRWDPCSSLHRRGDLKPSLSCSFCEVEAHLGCPPAGPYQLRCSNPDALPTLCLADSPGPLLQQGWQ